MLFNIETTTVRSPFVAPTLGGAKGGFCPQAGFRRVDGHAGLTRAIAPTFGNAGMVMGPNSWSPPIT